MGDQQIALNVLRKLGSNLVLEQKEANVVRLNSIGYRLIERELARLRSQAHGTPADERAIPPPPTRIEIRKIPEELGRPPDYISASCIIEGQSEIFWATDGFQQLTGYTVGKINDSGGAVMLPDDAELGKLKDVVENLFNGQKVSGDFQIKTKRGRLMTLQFVAWPLFDVEHHVFGSFTAARQVREGDTVKGGPKR